MDSPPRFAFHRTHTMNFFPPGCCYGISRRDFLIGAGAGLAGGASLSWLGLGGRGGPSKHASIPSFTGRPAEDPHPAFAMPGPYPGRVVEVHHPGSVRKDYSISAEAVKAMM